MKIAVKTLKGELFHVDAESTDTVQALKERIQDSKSDFAVDKQKLIHAGKVLKDSQTIAEIGMKDTDFIVCMVSKETAAKPKPVAETPAAAPSTAAPVTTAPPSSAPVTSTPTSNAGRPATSAPTQSFATAEGIAALTGMGFPEGESRSALEAAMGNPDLAYEFLLNGIPEQALAQSRMRQNAPAAAPSPSSSGSGTPALQQFRSHPQFEQLKQLVQSNPASLPQVLNLIGQQNPQLLEAIHANNEEFLSMMNEPINATPAAPPAAPQPAGGMMPGMGGGGPNPGQIVALLSALPPEQRAAFAQQVGLSPDQLNAFMQMVATLPPDQLQQLMPGGEGGGGGGGNVIRLTEEEAAAVTRLTQLGFTQQQAVQAYIACDKNEALAANLLFDGGFGFDDEDGGMGGGYGDYGGDEGGDDYN